jgi:hypothetical protein
MPDLLDRIRAEMRTRLAELRPLVDEHRRLEAALQALGDATTPSESASPASAARPRGPKPTPAKPRKRAPRGANREAVLRAVKDRPGTTSTELANVSGVERNTLYGLLTRLVNAGELQTQSLPTGRTGYALAGPQPQDLASTAGS